MLTRLRKRGLPVRRGPSAIAAEVFPMCEAHRREAAAVYGALEQMGRSLVKQVDLDVTIADCLPKLFANRQPVGDSLDVIEHQLAAEAERGHLTQSALLHLADESVMKPLLGPAAQTSRWNPSTIWMRSVRGVINERVRHSGACNCGHTPSNNKMQRTSHG
jgi:hypothetical protein